MDSNPASIVCLYQTVAYRFQSDDHKLYHQLHQTDIDCMLPMQGVQLANTGLSGYYERGACARRAS